MEFKFAKYTEITDYVFSREAGHKESGYSRFFICPDVWDFHLIRVLPGFGEDYDEDHTKIIVEIENIAMSHKGEKLTMRKLNKIIDEDSFENYDYHVFSSMDKVIESIADVFGILNLQS